MKQKRVIELIIKSIVFLVLAFLLTLGVGYIYVPWDHEESAQSKSYYDAAPDSVDVLIVGSSTVRNGISPNELWHNYGISAHTRGNSRQPAEAALFNLKEGLKYQKPKVVILGVTQLMVAYDYVENEPFLRKTLDYKKLSPLKIKTASEYVERNKDQDLLSYIFPVIRYHSRWNTMEYEDLRQALSFEPDFRRGQYRVLEIRDHEVFDLDDTDHSLVAYDPNSYKYYKEAVETAQAAGAKVLIVSMPYIKWSYGQYEAVKAFADEVGADYLDFSTDELVDAIDLDWTVDMYDSKHLNLEGCRKSSKFIGQYLIDHYGVPQWSCSEEVAAKYDADYELYKAEYDKFMKEVYLVHEEPETEEEK